MLASNDKVSTAMSKTRKTLKQERGKGKKRKEKGGICQNIVHPPPNHHHATNIPTAQIQQDSDLPPRHIMMVPTGHR
jgi:hypothetical protein